MFVHTEPRSVAHQSRSSLHTPLASLSPSDSSPFFSADCALLHTTAVSQPFVYQSLPHSFYHDEGIPLPYSGFATCHTTAQFGERFPAYSFSFHALPNSFAITKTQLSCFQRDPNSFAKNTRGWVPPSNRVLDRGPIIPPRRRHFGRKLTYAVAGQNPAEL
jgi:hypothetical protein